MTKQETAILKCFILTARWKFAKTMPQHPHEYTLREWNDDDIFNQVVMLIREHGYQKQYGSRTYTYLNAGKHRYWTMGSPLNKTILINRATQEAA